MKMENEGDISKFVRFIEECKERKIDMFLWDKKEYMKEIKEIEKKEWERRNIILDDGSGKWESE
jgi:hypothetical protein